MKYGKLKEEYYIYDGTHSTPNYVSTGIPFFSVESINVDIKKIKKFISEDVYNKEIKRVKPEKNDIYMTRIGDIGTPRIIDFDDKNSFYVTIALLKSRNNNNPQFTKAYIESDTFKKELWKKTLHVAFPIKINLSEIGELKYPIISIDNQKQIGSLFSSIDQLIKNFINIKHQEVIL